MNQLVPFTDRAPALIAALSARASYRFFEFFTEQIRNPNTRRAYARAAAEFFDVAARGVTRLAAINAIPTEIQIFRLCTEASCRERGRRLTFPDHYPADYLLDSASDADVGRLSTDC